MFDEIFIKEMSPIDAYKYGRQTMKKELKEIHLCECNKIRADAIEEFRNKLFGKLVRLTLSMWHFKLFDDALQETYNELKGQK